MPPRKHAKTSTPVQSFKHKDKRANIPTEELRDFVADEEKTPKTLLYPRDSTLDPQLVWKGKDEQGLGFDLLIVCGFVFDPHMTEEVKRYGKLTVLPARMNPDLAMGNELLKKTGAGNLFTVFGELTLGHSIRRPASSRFKPTDGMRLRSRVSISMIRRPAISATLPPTISPAGSSIPITTARASLSVTPTSSALTNPMRSSARTAR